MNLHKMALGWQGCVAHALRNRLPRETVDEYRARASVAWHVANQLELEAVDRLEEQEAKAARARQHHTQRAR